MRHLKLLLPLSLLTLAGCRDAGWGEPAPFEAPPAPATWERPADDPATAQDTPDAPRDDAARIWGHGHWPCEGHPACEQGSPEDQVLGLTVGGYEHIDPTLITETEGFAIAINLFEGLLNPARRSGEPFEMGVATSWTVSSDGLVYTFKLRPDAKWSNGRQVTADDFVYSWLRKLDPETAAADTDALKYIAGAREFSEGKEKDPTKVGVKALDPLTLEVTLGCPFPFWPSYLASGSYLPVPKEAVEAHGRRWTRAENIITNGPYHVTVLKERDHIVMVKSETYWDRDNVRIPSMIAYHADTEQAARALYDSGQVQWSRGSVSPGSIGAAIRDDRPDMLIDPILCVYYYLFRVDHPPFDNPLVRQAFDLAVNKSDLVNYVTRGMQIPATGPVPSKFEETIGYPRKAGATYNPQKARELLAEAGYPDGAGMPPIRIVYNTLESHQLIADFVARELEENLGVKVRSENMEWKSLLQKLRAGDFQIARLGSCGVDVPLSFLENFKSDSARNDTGWKSETFDRLFEKASCESTELKDALAVTAEAEQVLMDGRPIMPLYWYTRSYFRAPVLQGLEVHLEDVHPTKYMWWADTQQPPEPRPMPELVVLD